MELLPVLRQAELEREAAVALLNSLLRVPGSKKQLAEALGYTGVYSSLLRSVDRPGHSRMETRPFSIHVLRRLAELPWPPEVREELLYHIGRSISLRHQAHDEAQQLPVGELEAAVWSIREAHQAAQGQAPLSKVGSLERTVVEGGLLLLKRLSPHWNALLYLETLFCLNDAYSGVGAHARALYYALEAQEILEALDERLYLDGERERIRYMRVNVLRAVGIPRRNLGFPKEAYAYFEEAERWMQRLGTRREWHHHLASDKMGALADMKRFPISEAEGLARLGVQSAPEDQQERQHITLTYRLVDCYVTRGKVADAWRLLTSLPSPAALSTWFSPRHLMRFYRTQALCAARQGERELWRSALQEGLTLAAAGGLTRDYALLLWEHRGALTELEGLDLSASPRAWEGLTTYADIQARLAPSGFSV